MHLQVQIDRLVVLFLEYLLNFLHMLKLHASSMTLFVHYNYRLIEKCIDVTARFVQTLESPVILLFRIPGLESPGKRHRSGKTMEIPGKSWNSKAALLVFFLFLF